VLVMVAVAGDVAACSFSTSRVFEPRGKLVESPHGLPKLVLVSYNFVPRISDAGSCDGTGFISLRLKSQYGGQSLKRFGFRLKKVADTSNAVIPEQILSPYNGKDGEVILSWAWTWAEANSDGHFEWKFTVQPVNINGSVGESLKVCVSSNSSCDDG
jgi:hypothetical protein